MNEFLTKLWEKHGKRFKKAYEWLEEGKSVDKLVIEKLGSVEISGIVKGNRDLYTVYLSPNERTCSCQDHRTRKVYCKHMIFLILYSLGKGLINESEAEEIIPR